MTTTPWRDGLALELDALTVALVRSAQDHEAGVADVDPVHRADATNLLHYLALRGHDVRRLQRRLEDHGLSSLGRSESHVLASIRAVREAAAGPGSEPFDASSFAAGRRALDANTDALFGPRPPHRVPRIMVTLPTEAASDGALVRSYAERGMDVARINGAHDGPDAWIAMARNVASCGAALGRHIPISFDLPGPKLRTGPLVAGPRVLRLRPRRDLRGVATDPAPVVLTAGPTAELTPSGEEPEAPVDPEWLARCRPGDSLRLFDTRGAHRTLEVVSAGPGRVRAEAWDTTYLESGSTILRNGPAEPGTPVGSLPALEQHHLLRPGDELRLHPDLHPFPPWQPGVPGPAHIGCSLGAALDAVRPGDRVALDDGKLTGRAEANIEGALVVRIVSARPGGSRLRAGKGINLPDTPLPIPMLSEADTPLLEVAAAFGDMLALSFLRHEDDVDAVLARLDHLGADQLGLILKIETIPGFRRLPEILMRALHRPRVGVMIARGDLAVETSYERLAEIQEEILWLSEAAHVPVIWATEVLDQLARQGRPSRAEVTDAAMAQRAECVMLNKGPYMDLAIAFLDDILSRMAGHQRKKTALLRPLRSWSTID